MKIQLGALLLAKGDDFQKKILKDWDKRGKGEFFKGEFRQNLRGLDLEEWLPTDADLLFDSWDDDKSGCLDLNELKSSLRKAQDAATAYRNASSPNKSRANALRERAALAEDATEAMSQAEAFEVSLKTFIREVDARADVRLGVLLKKRKIKPSKLSCPSSAKYNLLTHFPRDPECEVCRLTKSTRAPCVSSSQVEPDVEFIDLPCGFVPILAGWNY